MKRRASDDVTFRALPLQARAYVVAVIVAGSGSLIAAALQFHPSNARLFAMLLGLAVAASAAKIELPLGRGQSNLSFSHAVNFWALFSLGLAPTAMIAAASAWAQCTLRAGARNPPHRVVFSISSLIVTVSIAGLPLALLTGGDSSSAAALARPRRCRAALLLCQHGAGRRGDRALDAPAGRGDLATQFPVERAELSRRRGARRRRHHRVDARLVRLARAAGDSGLPDLPQLSHRGRQVAGGAG